MMRSRLIRSAVGTVTFILALEVCARLDDLMSYGAPFFSNYSFETMYTQDAIGKLGKPYARFRKWALNGLGYRSPDLDPTKIRIVCFGASETFGLYESEGNEYPRQLERELNRNVGADEFQVINVANPGESTWTAVQRAPEIAREISPVVAIIYPTPSLYIYPPRREQRQSAQANASSFFEWRLPDRVWTLGKQVLPEVVQNKIRELAIMRSLRLRPAMAELPQQNVERYRSDLRELVLVLREYRVEPVLVTHGSGIGPNWTDHERRLLTAWRRFYPDLKELGFRDMESRMNQAVRSVGQQEMVPVIEADRLIPPGPVYFADFTHFTDAGAHLMAIRVALQLEPMLAARRTASLPQAALLNKIEGSSSR
jgi:hypothetical protein